MPEQQTKTSVALVLLARGDVPTLWQNGTRVLYLTPERSGSIADSVPASKRFRKNMEPFISSRFMIELWRIVTDQSRGSMNSSGGSGPVESTLRPGLMAARRRIGSTQMLPGEHSGCQKCQRQPDEPACRRPGPPADDVIRRK